MVKSKAEAVHVEKACAKINLGLKVLRRRPDGYHEIRSIMQSVDLADVLHFYPAAVDEFSCSDETLPTGPDNLVWRARQLFASRCDQTLRPFHIHLEKHIPTGAGLGGGSADAAAVLRALNELHDTPFELQALEEMAAQLGSDVPFLITGGTALVRGRGEILEPLQWRGEVWYTLVYPNVEVSTAWAYGQVTPGLTAPSSYTKFIDLLSGGYVEGAALFPLLENDFQGPVERTYPSVAHMGSYFDQAGALAHSMSGSGSTVYGIFDDRNAAQKVQYGLEEKGYRSFLCRPVLLPTNRI